MNRSGFALALVAALALSASAEAAWTCTPPGECSEAQALTRAVPSVATDSDWVSLSGIKSFRLSVCADSGQTLSGAGALHAYVRGAAAPLRNPSLDVNVTVTATSCAGAACRCQVFPDFSTAVGIGSFMFASSGITVSAGTVTVKIERVKVTQLAPRWPALMLAAANDDVALPFRRRDFAEAA